jgi:predicted transcriptional regulator
MGEINGVEILDDPLTKKVDMIAEALSLEKVGWIFTSINQDTFLTSQEIRKVAAF